jgi:hypothetical protein
MAWDSRRPIPWKRVLTPFALYAVVAVALFSVLGGGFQPGLLVGVVVGGAIYTALTVLMMKFGWNPPIFQSREERAEAAARNAERRAAKQAAKNGGVPAATASGRAKPPPTRRTNAGNRRAKTTRR